MPNKYFSILPNSSKTKEAWEAATYQRSSVQFSGSVMSDSLWPHRLQHARLPCPSPTPRACSNSCPSSLWFHPTISSSVSHPLLLLLLIFPSIRVFPNESVLRIKWQRNWSFSFSIVLPMNIQDWFPLGLTGLMSLQPKRLSRVFSSTREVLSYKSKLIPHIMFILK